MLPSASKADTALTCIGSVVLPGIQEQSEFSEAGNVLHRYADTARKRGKAAALAEAPEEEREWLEALDLDALPPGFESEVALGWDPDTDTGRRYELAEHRGYPDDGLFHGTADLVGIHMAIDGVERPSGAASYTARIDKVIVYDLKRFGAKVAAKNSAQLALLALAAARVAGADEAEVAMLQPGSRGWIVDRHQLDALDLEEWADRFRRLKAQLEAHREGTVPALTAGGHCTYCPALRWCPAQSAIVRQVAGLELATIDEMIGSLTDTEAGELWERALLVEKLADAAKSALRARATQAPIPLPGGKELRAVKWSQTVKSPVAKAELEALTAELAKRGEITKQPTTQVRAVARR
jgi:hypothetical protein